MLHLDLAITPGTAPRILCLGAHSDDIEIGCGGTMLKLLRAYPTATVHWVVFSALGQRADEARASAAMFLRGARQTQIAVEHFRDGYFPHDGAAIKDYFERLKAFQPDLVLTHYRDDRHQDHRVVSDLTWNTFRDHLVLEYEIPKYDGDLGQPNVFVHLDDELCRRKVAILHECFASQRDKPWFTEETFRAILRLRGIESRAPGAYAEAFYGRKVVI